MEDADLEIPDVGPIASQSTEAGYVHLPTNGPSPPSIWAKHSQLVADHIMAGSFETAFRLLHDQIGVVNFRPYKQHFLTMYRASRTISSWQQNIPSTFSYPTRNPKDSKNQLPVIGVKLADLVQQLQVCYQLTTGGKFTEAIEKFQLLLLQVPLLVVDTKQEISEANQLMKICKEYILGKFIQKLFMQNNFKNFTMSISMH